MIDAKQLIENSYFNSKDHSVKASALKRVRTTLAQLKIISSDSLALDLKEQKCISDTLALLDKAVAVHTKAVKLKKDIEKRKADRYAAALDLVMKSDFAKLDSIKDKVPLIFSKEPYMLSNIEKAWDMHYVLENTFKDCLNSISYSLAHQPGDMQEALGKIWAKFQENLPELYLKTARIVERMQQLLAAG